MLSHSPGLTALCKGSRIDGYFLEINCYSIITVEAAAITLFNLFLAGLELALDFGMSYLDVGDASSSSSLAIFKSVVV